MVATLAIIGIGIFSTYTYTYINNYIVPDCASTCSLATETRNRCASQTSMRGVCGCVDRRIRVHCFKQAIWSATTYTKTCLCQYAAELYYTLYVGI